MISLKNLNGHTCSLIKKKALVLRVTAKEYLIKKDDDFYKFLHRWSVYRWFEISEVFLVKKSILSYKNFTKCSTNLKKENPYSCYNPYFAIFSLLLSCKASKALESYVVLPLKCIYHTIIVGITKKIPNCVGK